MAIYVDRARHAYGRMRMCHMLADSDEELHAMAERIGVPRRWHQKAGTPHSHYDICQAMRAKAVCFGAQEVGFHEVAALIRRKRGPLVALL